MSKPLLNARLRPADRWPTLLRENPKLEHDWRVILGEFEDAADEIIRGTVGSFTGKVLRFGHRVLNPGISAFWDELRGISKYLDVSLDTLIAGQLVYEASTIGAIRATCGCTSMSVMHRGRPWHGRLLDWTWPSNIKVRLIDVVTSGGRFYTAEHIPGCTGFTGAYEPGFAANLNQAPSGSFRPTAIPALWWFRKHMESGTLRSLRQYPVPGPMADILLHSTWRDGTTARFYYRNGVADVWEEKMTSEPVVLTNTYDREDIDEDPDFYEWSKFREECVLGSKARKPMAKLLEAECAGTIFDWGVAL